MFNFWRWLTGGKKELIGSFNVCPPYRGNINPNPPTYPRPSAPRSQTVSKPCSCCKE